MFLHLVYFIFTAGFTISGTVLPVVTPPSTVRPDDGCASIDPNSIFLDNNFEYVDCTPCDYYCDGSMEICEPCLARCICKSGYFRNQLTGLCTTIVNCPRNDTTTTTTGFTTSGTVPPVLTPSTTEREVDGCESIDPNSILIDNNFENVDCTPCSYNCNGKRQNCAPCLRRCGCKSGYFRNPLTGSCTTLADCPPNDTVTTEESCSSVDPNDRIYYNSMDYVDMFGFF